MKKTVSSRSAFFSVFLLFSSGITEAANARSARPRPGAIVVQPPSEEPRPATPAAKETLLGNADSTGWMVSPQLNYSTILSNDALFIGAKGGVILDHQLVLGAGFYSLVSYAPGFNNVRQIRMSYGGAYIEYILNPEKVFHFSVSGLLGGGSGENNFIMVAEPAANLIFNVSESIHFGASVGYRFTKTFPTSVPNATWLSGLAVGAFLQVGDF